jgi:hypothetical protein
MIVEIRQAKIEDAAKLIASLREVDTEALMKFGVDPLKLIQHSIPLMETYVGLIDNEVVTIVFIEPVSMIEGRAKISILVTSLADKYPLIFARYTRRLLDRLLKFYPRLFGEVDPEYHRSSKWLRWLGFEVKGNRFERKI